MRKPFALVLALSLFLCACTPITPLTPEEQQQAYQDYINSEVDNTDKTVVFPMENTSVYSADYWRRMEKNVNALLKKKGVDAQIAFRHYANANAVCDIEFGGFRHYLDVKLNGADSPAGAAYWDMTDYVLAYPDLYAMHAPEVWNYAMIDGRILGIPTFLFGDQDFAATMSSIFFNPSAINALGTPLPQSPEELYQFCLDAKQAGQPYKLLYTPIYDTYFRVLKRFLAPFAFHRSYDEWPFYTDGIFIYDADGNVSSYVGSDVFEKDAALIKRFRDAGLLLEDDVFGREDQVLASFHNVTNIPIAFEYPGFVPVQFNPEKPNIPLQTTANGYYLFIPKSCPHPEFVMQVLNAIYTNPEIYDAFMYGEDGVDVRLYDDHSFESIAEDGAPFSLNRVEYNYRYYGVPSLNRFDRDIDTPYMRASVASKTMLDLPAAYFLFEDTLWLLKNTAGDPANFSGSRGVLAYRDGKVGVPEYESALAALKLAGLDELISQCQEQYTKYLQTLRGE